MTLGLGLLLCLLGSCAYRNSFTAPFLFDDMKLIGERVRYYADGNLMPLLAKTRRPLLHLSIAANYWHGGLNPVGYHILNLVIHLAAGLTLFGLARRTLLLPSIPERLRRASTGLAFAVAAIWLLHPLQTESVTYIVQRCESMMGLFYLLTMYCILRGSQSSRWYGWCLWYLMAVLFFHLGLGSKEVMVTALVVLPLYDRAFLSGSWWELIRRRWGLYAGLTPLLIWFAWGLVRTFDSTPRTSVGFGVQAVTPWEYLRSQPGVILHYLRLSFWPDALCLDYMWPVAASPWRIYPQGIAILAVASACVIGWWYRPRVAVLGLSFFLILAPTSSFVPIVDLAFEHRMYLSLAPLVALVVVGFFVLTDRLGSSNKDQATCRAAALAVVLLALTMRTHSRNADYSDPIRMWQDVVAKAPHNYAAYNNLAMYLAGRGNFEQAKAAYERSIEIQPGFAKTHDNFGNLFARRGQFEEAAKRYRTAIATDPTYERAFTHLGIVLHELGCDGEAIEMLQQAIRLDPTASDSARWLAWILATSQDECWRDGPRAVELAQQARRLNRTDDFRTLDVLAAAYAEAGRFAEAVTTARQACQLARQAGAEDNAQQSQQRLRLYQEGLPFRQQSKSAQTAGGEPSENVSRPEQSARSSA